MQSDAVERRLFDAAEAGIAAARRLGGGELPLVLAATEIGVDARARKAVEALRRPGERIGIDAELACELRKRGGARYGLGHLAADRLVREREALEILRI